MINQQRSPDEGNVQRLSRKGVGVSENIETESILTSRVEDEDIVQSLKSTSKLKSKEYFLVKAYEKYGNKFTFDLSNYEGFCKSKIRIICPIHGEFEQTPNNFLQKNCLTGCKQCGEEIRSKSKTKGYNNFLEIANKIHNNKYIYPEYNKESYKNRKSSVDVICPLHGKFTKRAQKHLSKQACWQCKIKELVDKKLLLGGYCEELFNNNPEIKDKKAYLYYLSINRGKLFKIGISENPTHRISAIKSKAKTFIKDIRLLWCIEDTLYNCFLKEQQILENYKEYRYYLKWSTELFIKDILPLSIRDLN